MKLGIIGAGMIVKDFLTITPSLKDLELVAICGKKLWREYFSNIERGIDTSGILILDYETFKCVCIAAKDCNSSIGNSIQGNKGHIYLDNSVNVCERFELIMNDGTRSIINENTYEHRMINEFIEFIKMIRNNDFDKCYKILEHSLIVSEVQTIARNKSGIIFPSDNNVK